MKCSYCPNEARPDQRTCRDCHAGQERRRRNSARNRLSRIELMLIAHSEEMEEIREYIRKGPHRVEANTEDESRRMA